MKATEHRLRVVSNFGDGDCGAGEIHTPSCDAHTLASCMLASRLLEISRVPVYFAGPTIAIAKIRDCSQSTLSII